MLSGDGMKGSCVLSLFEEKEPCVYIMPSEKPLQLQSRWACLRGLFMSAVLAVGVKPNVFFENAAAFPMASEDHLIMYHLIINESVLCRDGWRMAPYSLETKIMYFSYICKLFVLCSVTFAFHQLKKKQQKLAIRTSCIWNVGSSWSALAPSRPQCGRDPGIEVRSH